MNRMDDYFKKQLTDYQPADDGWNIPSEELWNNSKDHFPKPKKNRRFLLILLSLGLITIISTYYFLNINIDQCSIPSIETPSIHYASENNDAVTLPTLSQELESRDEQIINLNPNKTSTSKIKNIQASKNKDHLRKLNINEKKTTSTSTSFASNPVKINTNHANLSGKYYIDNEMTTTRTYSEMSMSDLTKPKALPLISMVPFIKAIDSKVLLYESESFKEEPILKLSIIPNVEPLYFSKHEIGIGSTLDFLAFLGKEKVDENKDWPEEEIYFNASNKININLHYNYLFKPKWSLSSGIYYHHVNFNAYGYTFDTLAQSSLDDFVINTLDNTETNIRQSNEQQIELIEGATVNAGDTLKINFETNLSYNSYLIPIVLNRNWNLGRTEIFIGMGASINLESWKQKQAEIELYRGNELITLPFTQDELDAIYMTRFSFIFQSGANYNITEKLKIGLTAKVFLPERSFIGLEARFLYEL